MFFSTTKKKRNAEQITYCFSVKTLILSEYKCLWRSTHLNIFCKSMKVLKSDLVKEPNEDQARDTASSFKNRITQMAHWRQSIKCLLYHD